MPGVDIPTPSDSPSGGSKGGIGGLGIPTPILLAVVGGGIGLVVFLTKKSSGTTGQNVGTGPGQNTLLPNTAIMLGSLQQGVLQLQGDVTQGNADLSSQLTGVGENLGSQIDAQSAGIQKSFGDLNTYLGSNFQALSGSETALSQAIAGLGTQNAGLADSLTSVLNNLNSVGSGIQQTQAQITGLGQGIQVGLGGISNQIQQNQQGLVAISGGVNQVLSNQGIQQADLGTLLDWENEIKARLQSGNYSAPYNGPSYQPWSSVASTSNVPNTTVNTTPVSV